MQSFATWDELEIAYQSGAGRARAAGRASSRLRRERDANWVATGVVDALLAAGRSVVAPDARGSRRSRTSPTTRPRYGEQRDGARPRRAARRDRRVAVDLVGYSMGAIVSLIFASTDERVRQADRRRHGLGRDRVRRRGPAGVHQRVDHPGAARRGPIHARCPQAQSLSRSGRYAGRRSRGADRAGRHRSSGGRSRSSASRPRRSCSRATPIRSRCAREVLVRGDRGREACGSSPAITCRRACRPGLRADRSSTSSS